jgi:hypothetical protein
MDLERHDFATDGVRGQDRERLYAFGTELAHARTGTIFRHQLQEGRMTMRGAAREVYSDHDFNLFMACAHCGQPVQRDEDGRSVHPVLAISTPDNGYDVDQAITLCSACLHDDGIESCYQEAMGRADDTADLRYLFQVLGVPEQQEQIKDFIRGLDPEPEPHA